METGKFRSVLKSDQEWPEMSDPDPQHCSLVYLNPYRIKLKSDKKRNKKKQH
jgi:hypothetical protein